MLPKLSQPKEIIRTTLGEFLILSDENTGYKTGIYVIACYPQMECLYIGKSVDITSRIWQHLQPSEEDSANLLRSFLLDNICSALKFRLDILIAPDGFEDDVELSRWLYDAETSLIKYFHPQFNVQNN